MEVAVLLLVFNRPDYSKIVINGIAKAKPSRMYIAADGPRSNVVTDADCCQETRNIILSSINWPCEVKTLFRDENLGCGVAVQSAIDWFFSQETEGIILEDDTLPNEDFFIYCSYMLNRYRNDETIFSINGCSLGFNDNPPFFGITRYFNMWGWATWKRSNELVKKNWSLFEKKPTIYEHQNVINSLKVNTIWGNKHWFSRWQGLFLKTSQNKINTWDYQWIFTALNTNSFVVRPSINYIENLGFGSNATHTHESNHELANMKTITKGFNSIDYDKVKPRIDNEFEIKYVANKWANYSFFNKSKVGQLYNLMINKLKSHK